MKKFCSVFCATAIAMSMAVPAFAAGNPIHITGDIATPGGVGTPGEIATPGDGGSNNGGNVVIPSLPSNATPGQVTQVLDGMADALLKNPANTDLAVQMVNIINNNKTAAVSAKTVAALRTAINYSPMHLGGSAANASFNATLHSSNQGLSIVPETAGINDSKHAYAALHFNNASNQEVQPKLGAIVTVKMDGKTMDQSDYVVIDENNRMIEGVQVTSHNNSTTISFWAPHFSTYAILPRSEYKGPNPGGDGRAADPIKKTGIDMTLSLASVIGLAGAAVAGGAAVAKKAKAE